MGRVLRDSFWISYDHLGKLVMANAIWFLLSFGAIILATSIARYAGWSQQARSLILASGFAVSLVTVPSVSAGMIHLTSLIVQNKDAEIKDLFQGMRRHFGRSVALGLVSLVVWAMLAGNIIFYARVIGPRNFWLGVTLGGVAIWMFAFYNVMLVYFAPLIVHRTAGPLGTFKIAALLTLDNLRLSSGLYISVWVIVLLACLTGVGIIFLMAGLSGVLLNVGYGELARRYERKHREKAGLEPLEEEDEYAGRGLRDILKPWEM